MAWYYYAAVAAVSYMKAQSGAHGYGVQKDQAKANARYSRQQGAAAEDTQRRQNALKLGEQRAAAAQSGFDSSSGSMATLQGQSAGELELDALTTRYNALMKTIGYENQAAVFKVNESQARTSAYTGGVMQALGGSGGGGYGG